MAYAGNDLDNYIYKLTQMVRGIGYEVDKIIKKEGGRWILLPLKQRLYNKGIDGSGRALPAYSDRYKERKRQYGVRSSPTTLRMFGNWYKSMFIESKNGAIQILTDASAKNEPEKTDYLIEKYGEDILTLTVEEQEEVAKKLTKILEKQFNDIEFPPIIFK